MSTSELGSHSARLRRRERTLNHITSRLTPLRVVLFVVGYGWLLLLPWKGLSRRAWIDENALQPGQVNIEWNWGDVKTADRYLETIEEMWKANTTSRECVAHPTRRAIRLGRVLITNMTLRFASYIQGAFTAMGLEANTQKYSFVTHSGVRKPLYYAPRHIHRVSNSLSSLYSMT